MRNVVAARWFAGALCGLLLALPAAGSGRSPQEQIAAETGRLQQLLTSLNLAEEDARPSREGLKLADEALRAGRSRLGLYRLYQAGPILMAYGYRASKAAVEQGGVAAFEAEWRRLGGELAGKEKRLAGAALAGQPAAVRAVAESALSQVRPYYQSGRLYGLNTTINSGLYYLGATLGYLDFALFCRGLPAAAAGRAPRLRPLAAELAALEAETLAAYRRADVAKQQPAFNRVNSALKLAGELNKERRYPGALLQYLDAAYRLGIVTAPPADPARAARLKAQREALHARSTQGNIDHSIGLLFLEMADEALARPDDPEARKRAAVLLEQVLPRYFNYVTGGK